LTPHGKKISEDAFKDKYEIHINAQGDQWLYCVQRLASTIQNQCYLKAVEEEGLAFGGCSCGISIWWMFLWQTQNEWHSLCSHGGCGEILLY
jgi:hypothetical protein